MRRTPRLLALAAVVALGARAGAAQAPGAQGPDYRARYRAIVAARGAEPDSARLARLLALDWEQSNLESPELATYTGYPGQNGRWSDESFVAIRRRRLVARDPLDALLSIDRGRLTVADQLTYDLFRRDQEVGLEGLRFPQELLAVTQLDGPQYAANLIAQQPARTAADYADILSRLDSLPRVLADARALLDSGLAVGVTPPRVTLRDVPAQLDALLSEDVDRNPLAEPFTRVPAALGVAERERLRAGAALSLRTRAVPAYRAFRAYLADVYLPRARTTIAASALPDGPAWYAYNVRRETTVDRAPAEIHRIGLAEVARIRGAMDSVMRATGFAGSFAEFTRMLRTDPRFFLPDSASLVRAYRDVAKRVDPGLIRLFGRLPRTPYGVETVPSFSAPSQTTAYYQPGSPDAGRPGMYMVNTYRVDTRPTWEMEALTLHESVPGHHLQIALAQELPGAPPFRRYGQYTAFVEGWGLYAESLGPELGMYKDPYSKFGQLTYEVWRAIRLVLDTGIHSMGWSRERAIRYFVENSAKTEHDITVEVDRYIAWPGQALAYKTGQLEIRALRGEAERALGPRFDVRAFHDEVLGAGALPLSVLRGRVTAWTDSVRSGR